MNHFPSSNFWANIWVLSLERCIRSASFFHRWKNLPRKTNIVPGVIHPKTLPETSILLIHGKKSCATWHVKKPCKWWDDIWWYTYQLVIAGVLKPSTVAPTRFQENPKNQTLIFQWPPFSGCKLDVSNFTGGLGSLVVTVWTVRWVSGLNLILEPPGTTSLDSKTKKSSNFGSFLEGKWPQLYIYIFREI